MSVKSASAMSEMSAKCHNESASIGPLGCVGPAPNGIDLMGENALTNAARNSRPSSGSAALLFYSAAGSFAWLRVSLNAGKA